MTVLCVTGTSTDVGKTVVTAALAALAVRDGIRTQVCKPIQTGVRSDQEGDLSRVGELSPGAALTEFARFPAPMAPQDAARMAAMPLPTRAELAGRLRDLDRPDALTLIEGAGGLLVRLTDDDATLLDLAADFDAPILVVTTVTLGTLNHTELTVRAIAAAGVSCAGLVIGSLPGDPDEVESANVRALPQITGIALRGWVPADSGTATAAEFLAAVTNTLDTTGLWDSCTRIDGAVVG